MLRVGLTGGIASGKSSVAARLRELGARLIDSDVLAREVVAAGTAGLAAVVERFGTGVLGPDGELDRPALGRTVFGDAAARGDLEAIIHPLVLSRTRELTEQAPDDAIVVHDIPLLVELDRGGDYHLVVIVAASEELRGRRLVEDRGMSAEDAGRRIAAQADDEARRRAADVWLPNEGSREQLRSAVNALWHDRLVPFDQNLRGGLPSSADGPVDYAGRDRIIRRLERQCERAGTPASITTADDGSIDLRTSSPGTVGPALAGAGFVPVGDDRYASADPAVGLVVAVIS